MKRVANGRRVLTGRIKEGTYNGSENRIQLFDGKFTTGYRIISFKIAPASPTVSQELIAKLSSEPKSNVTTWFWDDVQDLAWAHWGTDKYQDDFSNVREDATVVEDLYISAYNETLDASSVNYEIILEKVEFPAWTGAGILVENLSQGGPE